MFVSSLQLHRCLRHASSGLAKVLQVAPRESSGRRLRSPSADECAHGRAGVAHPPSDAFPRVCPRVRFCCFRLRHRRRSGPWARRLQSSFSSATVRACCVDAAVQASGFGNVASSVCVGVAVLVAEFGHLLFQLVFDGFVRVWFDDLKPSRLLWMVNQNCRSTSQPHWISR